MSHFLDSLAQLLTPHHSYRPEGKVLGDGTLLHVVAESVRKGLMAAKIRCLTLMIPQ